MQDAPEWRDLESSDGDDEMSCARAVRRRAVECDLHVRLAQRDDDDVTQLGTCLRTLTRAMGASDSSPMPLYEHVAGDEDDDEDTPSPLAEGDEPA
ncbi:hypothetical protein BH11GEM1_BH11GEM1_14860 [soil metagenome]